MANDPDVSPWRRDWSWRQWPVGVLSAPATHPGTDSATAVVLIHGFGACKEHWRHNLAALRAERDVHALDLIGFGASGKPRSQLAGEPDAQGSLRYGIDLWRDQVVDFISAAVDRPVQLVGNSIGGVVALAAARRLEELGRPASGVVLVDCAQRALDDKRLAEQPPLRRWGRPLLKSLVRQRWLTAALFKAVARPGVIRKVLLQAYPSGANVDEQLVTLLLKPTQDPGADEAFRGFINLFNDRIAPELLAELNTPVTLIWGQQDPWEPIEEARRWCQFACVRTIHELPGLGHCPHDEAPELVNPLLLAALREGDPIA